MSSFDSAEPPFEKRPVFHYQTNLGKAFTAMPDSENIGLDELRKNEFTQIEQFINDKHSKILVIGGFSSTGKTYLFKKFAKTNNYAYADWQMYGQFLKRQDIKSIIERIQTKNTSTNNTLLIMDENIAPITKDESSINAFKETIKELLQHYSKLILLGGGSTYTSDKQTSLIREQLDFRHW